MDKQQQLQAKQDELYELGQWLGRKQAFGLIAGKAAAADVECLRRIRESKVYRAKGVSWSEFCKQYAGITRVCADKLIKQLEQFGPNYFHLSQLVRISPEAYRLIAPAVGDSGIAFGGEVLAFAVENAPKIAAAVSALRADAETKRPPEGKTAIAAAAKRLDACVAELNRIGESELGEEQREELASIVSGGIIDLKLVALSLI